MHEYTWLSAFVRLPHLQARSRLFVVCAEMSRCLWHVKNLLWQPPYSNFHKTLVRLRKSPLALISNFVETWSVQGVPLGMYAPEFLSFVNSLVLWGLYGHAGRVDQALRGVKLKLEVVGSRRLLQRYSDESYHREESAPGGRSLLRGHAYC